MKHKLTLDMLESQSSQFPFVSIEDQLSFLGGGDGTLQNPYSVYEYDYKIAHDAWEGGYVYDPLSDITKYIPTLCCANVYADNLHDNCCSTIISYTDYDMSSYLRSQQTDISETVIQSIASSIASTILSLGIANISNLNLEMASQLVEKGYGSNDKRFTIMLRKLDGYADHYQQLVALDAQTGEIIVTLDFHHFAN